PKGPPPPLAAGSRRYPRTATAAGRPTRAPRAGQAVASPARSRARSRDRSRFRAPAPQTSARSAPPHRQRPTTSARRTTTETAARAADQGSALAKSSHEDATSRRLERRFAGSVQRRRATGRELAEERVGAVRSEWVIAAVRERRACRRR